MAADTATFAPKGRGHRQRRVLRLIAERGHAGAEQVAEALKMGVRGVELRLAELRELGFIAGEPAIATDAGRAALEASDRKSPLGRALARKQRVDAARLIRHQHPGISMAEIADRMRRDYGVKVAPATVKAYFYDRDASIARRVKQRYRGQCAVCGAETVGRSRQDIPDRCPAHREVPQRTPAFGRDAMIEVLREWERRFGEQPTSTALRKDYAKRKGGEAWERWQAFGLHHVQVIREFGTVAAALAEAFPAPPREAAPESPDDSPLPLSA